jgi:hypothetical protein
MSRQARLYAGKGDGGNGTRAQVLGRASLGGVKIRFFQLHIETYHQGKIRYFSQYEIDQLGGTRGLIAAAKR